MAWRRVVCSAAWSDGGGVCLAVNVAFPMWLVCWQGRADGQNAAKLQAAAVRLRQRCADYIIQHRYVIAAAMRVRECVSACAASDEGSYVRCAAADMSACLSVCHDAASVVLQGVVGVVLPLTISLTFMAAAHLSSVMELRHFCTPLGEDTLPRACLTLWPWAPKGAVAGAHGCRAWFESMNANLCMILSSGSLDPFDVFDHQVPQSVLAYYLVCGAGHSHTAASEKTAARAIHPADASRVTRKACEQPLQLQKSRRPLNRIAAELPVDRRMPAMARPR